MPQQREPGRRSGPAGEAGRYCWEGQEEERWTTIGNSLHQSMHMSRALRAGQFWHRLQGCEKPLAHLGETGCFLCSLLGARHLLGGLRHQGAKCDVVPLA